jgi:LacI family transcriptional regulator
MKFSKTLRHRQAFRDNGMAEDVPARAIKKRVTLKEVAKAAEVSLGSASYAINGTGSVDEKTRARVLKAAKKLGYRQNLSAQAMRTGRTRALGLVLPDFTNPFFTSLAHFVMRSARTNGYSVFVTDTEGDEGMEREALSVLVERGVEGIVWFPIRDINTAESLTQDIPTVVIDRTISGLESIQADYAGGGRLAAEHLVGLGHKHIGVISGPMDISSMRERVRGATEYIEKHAHLAFSVANAFSVDLEPEVMRAIVGRKATAVIVGADLIAFGVIKAASDAGINVPRDLSVIGFDDVPWAQLSTPTLTTIEMPLEEMAGEAIEALLRRIEGRANSRRQVVFSTDLVMRNSTRALKP